VGPVAQSSTISAWPDVGQLPEDSRRPCGPLQVPL